MWLMMTSVLPALPHRMDIPVKFELWTSGMLHGLAFWFDVAFIGSA